jgi:hypothetical protein
VSKRKPYRRGIATVSAIYANQHKRDERALAQPMSDEQITDLSLAFRLAFSAMITGRADELQWATCVGSLNIALMLCEYGVGAEYVPQMNQALEGAFRARIRADRTGKFGFDGDAITAIETAYRIHEEQLKIATKSELREAVHESRWRVESGNVFECAA